MSRLNQVLILLLVVVIVVTLVRLLLPYGISETNNSVPDIYSAEVKDNTEQYLAAILAQNLWDKDRGILEKTGESSIAVKGEVKDSMDDGREAGSPVALKLVAVSRGEGEMFAVIETYGSTERFAPGEILPDGSQLDEILEYGIRISNSEKNERLYLFGKN